MVKNYENTIKLYQKNCVFGVYYVLKIKCPGLEMIGTIQLLVLDKGPVERKQTRGLRGRGGYNSLLCSSLKICKRPFFASEALRMWLFCINSILQIPA